MRKLVAFARRRKLDAIHGDILDDNTPMLQLVEALGFRYEANEYTGMTRVRLALAREQDAAEQSRELR
jgi:ribosomal protein L17